MPIGESEQEWEMCVCLYDQWLHLPIIQRISKFARERERACELYTYRRMAHATEMDSARIWLNTKFSIMH